MSDSEMLDRMAYAMQTRAKEPLGNIDSLESIPVGCLGDAWKYLARAALEVMREPTEAQKKVMWELLERDNRPPTKRWHWVWHEMIEAALPPQAPEGARQDD